MLACDKISGLIGKAAEAEGKRNRE